MQRIELLPNWVLTNKYPAFYDTESATAVEQTAKVYGTMQELIKDYNAFANEINSKITEFIDGTNKDQECFKNDITKIMNDYISMMDTKIKELNLLTTNKVNDFINQAIAEGKIVITTAYDESNENLNIVGGA